MVNATSSTTREGGGGGKVFLLAFISFPTFVQMNESFPPLIS